MSPNYYSVLPANVRYADIPDKAKILYSEISALTNKFGYCSANNEYFGKLYDMHKNSISRLINQLEEAGFVSTELLYRDNSKEIVGRRIYLQGVNRVEVLPFEDEQNVNRGVLNFEERGVNKIVKDNNINYNTTRFNSALLQSVLIGWDLNSLEKKVYKISETVKLSGEELFNLLSQFGEVDAERMIKKLDDYKASTGRKYSSDYRAILSWVVKWLKDEGTKIVQRDSDYD